MTGTPSARAVLGGLFVLSVGVSVLATDGQSTLVADNHEYPANPTIEPEPLIRDTFGTDFRRDPLRADVLGSSNADAVRAMDTANFG